MIKRIKSFYYAFKGIGFLIFTQPNARIHLLATIGVVVAGIFFDISGVDWLIVSSAITLVWVTEALNTAIEVIIDLVSPDFHQLAGKAKDLAAGAVLIAAGFSVFCGFFVFYEPVIEFFDL